MYYAKTSQFPKTQKCPVANIGGEGELYYVIISNTTTTKQKNKQKKVQRFIKVNLS